MFADSRQVCEPRFDFLAEAVKIARVVPQVFDGVNDSQGKDCYVVPCPIVLVPCLKSVTFLDNLVSSCQERVISGHRG